MKKIGLLAVVVALLGGVAWLLFEAEVNRPGWRPGGITFEVMRGEPVRAVARRLEEEGAIGRAWALELEIRRRGSGVKAGEYRFPEGSSARMIAEMLILGRIWARPVTIREGLTLEQTAAELERAGVAQAAEFLRAAGEKARSMKEAGFPGPSLEGYLFPETYHLPKSIPARAVVETMLATFRAQAAKALPPDTINDPAALHRVVTLASIIEKETGAGFERPLISAVFHNRLKKGMLLQSDPTVIYSLPNFDGNIRRKDLDFDSPYNTYRYRGLPPGPIASPGLDSIKAAWEPAESDFLYFVSKNNGEHYFSRTLAEHNRAVQTFQIRRGRK